VAAEQLQRLVESVDQGAQKKATFFRGGLGRSSNDSGGAVAVDTNESEVGTCRGFAIVLVPVLAYELRREVQEDGRLSFTCMHVVMHGSDTTGGGPCSGPVRGAWEEQDGGPNDIGLWAPLLRT
jgi:hypothetical protein